MRIRTSVSVLFKPADNGQPRMISQEWSGAISSSPERASTSSISRMRRSITGLAPAEAGPLLEALAGLEFDLLVDGHLSLLAVVEELQQSLLARDTGLVHDLPTGDRL